MKVIEMDLNYKPLVSFVIVNWNTRTILEKCIKIIKKNISIDYQIVVVDNGSIDGSVDMLKDIHDKKIDCIFLEKNFGYAKANNIGIKNAKGRFICLLNSDAFITKNSIEYLVESFDEEKIGLVGPCTNKSKGIQCKRKFFRLLPSILKSNKTTEYLSFFCVLIKSQVVEKIGYLDESFGLGTFEDDDYCKRAILAGYELKVIQKSWVWHLAHATMDANNIEESVLINTNNNIFNSKWAK